MNVPKYAQLRSELEQLILAGMSAHTALPSERDLMTTYRVSRMTVREALTRLVDDGLIYRVHGAGTFVADQAKITKSLTLTSFSEDIRSRRMEPGSISASLKRVEADANIASILGISPGGAVVHLERVRTADGVPMCLESVWIPGDVLPENFSLDTAPSVYEYLDSVGRAPESATQTIQATVLDSVQAALLDVPPQSPAMSVTRVAVDSEGREVEFAISLYRADRYDYRITVKRERRR
ncbi:GntR family transcriptional regulator [Cryobacterium sp. CAN_C3]|uniref:GntR family transcriptional regulator n=1 Tax=unclassified Cryobacterium TaxID=2649013 RepID=UPI0018CA7D22|nr:GntR family transcriptional regulator [Cryobacterium sp. CAN_C3]MEC5153788.1 GntR family transcriptional regulator [Cryobacterium sp. CAN_C3]